jgi:hypothetical protein
MDSTENLVSFEQSRSMRNNVQYLRNKAYYKELRNIQKEGFDDSQRLLAYFKFKLSDIGRILQVWKAVSGTDSTSTRNSLFQNPGYHEAGALICKLFNEMDNSYCKLLNDFAIALQKVIIPSAEEKMLQLEKTTKSLWEKGKMLLLAWYLMEKKITFYYETMITRSQYKQQTLSQTEHHAQEDRLWLIIRYYAAVQRLQRLAEKINHHFRIIFQIAKELEVSRVSMLIHIAELFTTKITEIIPKTGLITKQAIGK